MDQIDSFVRRADRVAQKLGIARSTLSAQIFNDGKKLDTLRTGGDLKTRTYLAADAKLAKLEKSVGLGPA